MARMDGPIGVLHDDAVDGKVNIGRFPDGKVVAKGCTGESFDLP